MNTLINSSTKRSHAYLMFGAEREELLNKASELIASLENISDTQKKELLFKRIEKSTHPDIGVLGKNENSIKIDTIRSIYDFILIKPDEFDHRYVIIRDTDNMSDIVQNALLKILEDPPTDCVIILLANSKESFLPTILSRVVTINTRTSDDFGLNMQESLYLREAMAEIIIYANLEKLFDTSKMLGNGEIELKKYLYEMYRYFSDMLSDKLPRDDTFVMMADNGLYAFADKAMKTITETLNALENNASAQLLIESMFIKLLEEYNAKSSRYPL